MFDIHRWTGFAPTVEAGSSGLTKTANRRRIEQEHKPTHFFPFLSFPFFFSLQFIWFVDSTFHQRKEKELAWDLESKKAKHYKEESETEVKIFCSQSKSISNFCNWFRRFQSRSVLSLLQIVPSYYFSCFFRLLWLQSKVIGVDSFFWIM